jgi:hypothetical protein
MESPDCVKLGAKFKELATLDEKVLKGDKTYASLSSELQHYFCQCCQEGNKDRELGKIFFMLMKTYPDHDLGYQLCQSLARDLRLYKYYFTPPLSLAMRVPWTNEEKNEKNVSTEEKKSKKPVSVMVDSVLELENRKDLAFFLMLYGADPKALCYYDLDALQHAKDESLYFSSPVHGLAEYLQHSINIAAKGEIVTLKNSCNLSLK